MIRDSSDNFPEDLGGAADAPVEVGGDPGSTDNYDVDIPLGTVDAAEDVDYIDPNDVPPPEDMHDTDLIGATTSMHSTLEQLPDADDELLTSDSGDQDEFLPDDDFDDDTFDPEADFSERSEMNNARTPAPSETRAKALPPTALGTRITSVVRPLPEDRGTPTDRLNRDVVSNLLAAGQEVQFDIVRAEPEGETAFALSHTAIRPRGAELVDLRQARAAAAEAPTVDQVYTKWAVLTETRQPEPEKPPQQKSDEVPPNHMAVTELISRTSLPYAISVHASPVLGEELMDTRLDINDRLHNFTERDTVTSVQEQRRWMTVQAEIEQGQGVAARRTVMVGARNEAELREILAYIPNAVVSSENTIMGTEMRNGDVAIYDNREQILSSRRFNPHAVVSPERWAHDNQLPVDEQTAGLLVKDQFHFAATREVPAGKTIASFEQTEHGPEVYLIEDSGIKRPYPVPIDSIMEHMFWGGAAGTGKTTSAEIFFAGVLAAGMARHEANPDVPAVKFITLNGQKSDGTVEHIAALMKAKGSDVGYRVNQPGGGHLGVPVTIDVHDTTMKTIQEGIQDSRDTLAIGIAGDADTIRMAYRYLLEGIVWARVQLGANPKTNKSEFKMDDPADPTAEFLIYSVRQHLDEGSWQDKAKGDIGEWTTGPLKTMPYTLAGDFFHGGAKLDFNKLLNSPEVIEGFDLDKFGNDNTSRQIAVLGFMNGLITAVDDRNDGADNIPNIQVIVHIEEAYGIFDDTPLGDALAKMLRVLRSKGIGISISLQNGYKNLNPTILSNCKTAHFFGTLEQNDAEVVSERALLDEHNVKYLTDPHLPKGQGLVVAPGLAAARIGSIPPNVRQYGTPKREGNAGIADLEIFSQYFRPEEIDLLPIRDAEEWLTSSVNGSLMRINAGYNVGLVLSGRLPQKLAGTGEKEYKQAICGMTGAEGLKRDVAIIRAVESAVNGRKIVMHVAKRKEFIQYIAGHMIAEARGVLVPREIAPPMEFVLDNGKMTPIIDRAHGKVIARSLPMTQARDRMLGDIGGVTAVEQLDGVDNAEKRTIELIKKAVIAKTATPQASQELAKLVIGVDEEKNPDRKILEEIRDRLGYTSIVVGGYGIDYIRKEVVARMGRGMNPEEKAAFDEIVKQMPDINPLNTYATVRRELTKAIVNPYMTAEAVRVDDLEHGPYRTAGPRKTILRIPGKTAREQINWAVDKQREIIKNSEYAEDVTEEMMLYGHDLLVGGVDIDNAVAVMLSRVKPAGPMTQAQHRQLRQAGVERMSYAKLLESGDPRRTAYRRVLTKTSLYTKNFRRPRAATLWLVRYVTDTVRTMQTTDRAAKARALEMAKYNQAKQVQ